VAVPRLSVLVPARNAADTIESALRSTLRALPDDAEVLVLDDASSDRTPELVRGIGDRRVKLTVAPENLGSPGRSPSCSIRRKATS
jgi:glycosyltransferase involved in cell wall biosynthesis